MNSNQDTGPHRIAMSEWIDCAPFEKLLSMDIVTAQDGQAVLRMPFYRSYAQGSGLMHGGALVSLADTAMVMAIKSILRPGTYFATISMQSRFLRPVKKGIVEARATIVEQNGSTINGSCAIYDEAKRNVMTFDAVFKVVKYKGLQDVVPESDHT